MDLEGMKYSELQKMAKTYGIKANMKSQKLIEALKEYLESNSAQQPSADTEQPSADELTDVVEPAKCDSKMNPEELSKSEHHETTECSEPDSAFVECQTNVETQKRQRSVDVGVKTIISPVTERGNADSSRELFGEGTFEDEDSEIVFKNFESSETSDDADLDGSSNKETESVQNSEEGASFMDSEQEGIAQQSSFQAVTTRAKRKRSITYTVDDDNVDAPVVDEHSGSRPKRTKRCSKEDVENVVSTIEDKTIVDSESQIKVKPQSQIPRLQREVVKAKRFSAGYWAKIHQRNFDKMESIDDYMKKKESRMLSMFSPNGAAAKKLTAVKPSDLNKSVNADKQNRFVPTVLSTSKMNVNFCKIYSNQSCKKIPPKDDQNAVKLLPAKPKTPAPVRVERNAEATSTRPKTPATAKVDYQRRKSFTCTPGQSMAQNAAMNATVVVKPKFDLFASLEKPLSWKPYVGKLKPLEISHKTDVKAVTVKSRSDRREDAKRLQEKQRQDLKSSRRGILQL